MINTVEKFFFKALFISLAAHMVFMCGGLWRHELKPDHPRKNRGVEVTYKPQVSRTAPDIRRHPIKPAQQLDLKNALMGPSNGEIPLKLGKEQQSLAKDFMMYERRPRQIRSTQMAVNRVSVVPIKSEKINNPAYAAYNEMVRSRIESKVYEHYHKMEAGTVYLTFIIASDGSLNGAQIIEEKTHAGQNLKDISLKSLRASQFPPFLKGMTLPEYTFNIEIQYQVRD
ncbi:MAG: hypothetical protein HY591_01940 [Candidatus Omnitrophica bacterium]|nr:hypothetical protein [Candidatus Omnitrophota bacterium]